MRVDLPIVGEAYQTRWAPVAAQRCVNLFLTTSQDGTLSLVNSPGISGWCWPQTSFTVRGMHYFKGEVYFIAGDTLYSAVESGLWTALDAGSLPASGIISMADNGTELMIVDGENGWIWNGSVLFQIADADFKASDSCAFMDGYFICVEKDSPRFFLSALYDGTTYEPEQFATAESAPDDLIKCLVDNRELWLFGDFSTEVWWNAGETFPFARIPGATMNIGCAAKESPATINNTVFWLGSDRLVYRADAYQPANIANEGVAQAIAGYDVISDAVAYCYEEEGHYFYVLSFPSEPATWVYSINNGKWHERWTESFGRHAGQYHVYAWSNNYICDFRDTPLIHKMSMDNITDYGTPIRRIRSTTAYSSGGNHAFWAKVGLECNSGDSKQGEVPQVMFRYSDDGGRTWSNEIWQPFGRVGDYRTRVEYGPLGRSLNRAYEFSITHSGSLAITGAYAEVELGG